MKLMLVFGILSVILACAWAAPQGNKDVEVLEQTFDTDPDGSYKFSYTLSDGTTRTEEGTLVNVGTENESISIKGTVTWVAPDGQSYTLNFVGDDNGFQPEGAHLPK